MAFDRRVADAIEVLEFLGRTRAGGHIATGDRRGGSAVAVSPAGERGEVAGAAVVLGGLVVGVVFVRGMRGTAVSECAGPRGVAWGRRLMACGE
jgi:hypothetical protein